MKVAVPTAGLSTWDFWKKFLRLFVGKSQRGWVELDMIGPYKSRLKIESFESPSPRVNFAAEILGSLKLAV